MSDNLPEINIGGRKERKGGFLGWLRGLGSGPAGAIGAAGSSSAGSAGLGILLAGKLGIILTAVVAVGLVGGYVANKKTFPATSSGAFNSAKVQKSEYIPAILRSQAANQGSSLAMFTDTNKGSGLSLNETAAGAKKAADDKKAKDAEAAAGSGEAGGEEGAKTPDVQSMVDGAMPALQGGAGASSLTTSIGGSGGSSKFSGGMGGKIGQGAMGPKAGMTGNLGAGFAAMPKFQERKGKLLAMKGAARPITGGGKSATSAKFGSGSRNQLNAMRAKQKSYIPGTGVDSMRATQDAAWTGTTATGDAGAGLGEGDGGGAGIMTSPSMDNPSGSDGGNTNGSDYTAPDPCPGGDVKKCADDVSPWKDDVNWCYGLIVASLALSVIGALIVDHGYAAALVVGTGSALIGWGKAVCVIAGLLAAAALAVAVFNIGIDHKQGGLALILGAGATCAVGASITAGWGDFVTALGTPLAWMVEMAGVCMLISAMLGLI